MSSLAALLLVCVAVASAQVPRRCKSPDAWEARFYDTRIGSSYTRAGRIYYDAPGERVAIVEEYFNGDQETARYEEYFFHKQRYFLRYNTESKTCYRYNLTEPFIPVEVPITAQFLDTLVIGTNANEKFGVTVNVWGDDSGTNGRRILEFVADDGDGDEDCLPVSTMEFGGPPGSTGFRVQRYFDIVIGVNPSHFIPPENCPRQR